tara:strand:+ start:688 stop:1380 length:693 start_codon:yes stop_codon:yes gene_type:complete
MTLLNRGKVKSIFDVKGNDEQVVLQYHDKVTAGNGKRADFPEGKGRVCCEISAFLFNILEQRGIKTHYISCPSPSHMQCKKVNIIPIEVVVRNVAAGSIVRQTTIEEGTEFDFPLVEFYLKDDEKDDPLLTIPRLNMMGYGGDIERLINGAKYVNVILKEIFREIGLTLIDFKLEFGYDSEQNLLLADELSPDGMRLWKEGKSFDKDLFRKGEGDIVEAYNYILDNLRGN